MPTRQQFLPQPQFDLKLTPRGLRNKFDDWVEKQTATQVESYARTTSQKRQYGEGKVMLQKFENKRMVPMPLLIEDFLEYAEIYHTWDQCVRQMRIDGGYDQVIAHIQNVIKAHNRRGTLLGYCRM